MTKHESIHTGRSLGTGGCAGCPLNGLPICTAFRTADLPGARPPRPMVLERDRPLGNEAVGSDITGILRSGYLRMERISHDGRRDLIGLVVPGDLIGTWLGRDQGITIEAATTSQICSFDPATLRRLMNSDPGLRVQLLRETAEQHARLLELIWRRGALSSRERIIAIMLMATEIMPVDSLKKNEVVMKVEFSRKDWASLANTTVETVCRTLGQLSEKGLIEAITPSLFRIADLDRLARCAGLDPKLDTGWLQQGERIQRGAQTKPVLKVNNTGRLTAAARKAPPRAGTVVRPI